VASLGTDRRGRLFNVNADTLAGDLAVRVGARRFIVAGATRGVLDGAGRTIAQVDDPRLDALICDGDASVGMIAKLLACRVAGRGGVGRVEIVDGRRAAAFDLERTARTGGTRITAGQATTRGRESR
jgi:acetylglutamate kinase